MRSQRFVIIGGGLAGASAAEALRERGFDGEILIIGAESRLHKLPGAGIERATGGGQQFAL